MVKVPPFCAPAVWLEDDDGEPELPPQPAAPTSAAMAARVLHVYSLRPRRGDLTTRDTWAPPYPRRPPAIFILDRSSSRKEQEITLWRQKSARSPHTEPGDRLAGGCGARLVTGGWIAPFAPG